MDCCCCCCNDTKLGNATRVPWSKTLACTAAPRHSKAAAGCQFRASNVACHSTIKASVQVRLAANRSKDKTNDNDDDDSSLVFSFGTRLIGKSLKLRGRLLLLPGSASTNDFVRVIANQQGGKGIRRLCG